MINILHNKPIQNHLNLARFKVICGVLIVLLVGTNSVFADSEPPKLLNKELTKLAINGFYLFNRQMQCVKGLVDKDLCSYSGEDFSQMDLKPLEYSLNTVESYLEDVDYTKENKNTLQYILDNYLTEVNGYQRFVLLYIAAIERVCNRDYGVREALIKLEEVYEFIWKGVNWNDYELSLIKNIPVTVENCSSSYIHNKRILSVFNDIIIKRAQGENILNISTLYLLLAINTEEIKFHN